MVLRTSLHVTSLPRPPPPPGRGRRQHTRSPRSLHALFPTQPALFDLPEDEPIMSLDDGVGVFAAAGTDIMHTVSLGILLDARHLSTQVVTQQYATQAGGERALQELEDRISMCDPFITRAGTWKRRFDAATNPGFLRATLKAEHLDQLLEALIAGIGFDSIVIKSTLTRETVLAALSDLLELLHRMKARSFGRTQEEQLANLKAFASCRVRCVFVGWDVGASLVVAVVDVVVQTCVMPPHPPTHPTTCVLLTAEP